MDEYVWTKLHPIEVPKEYLSNTKEVSEGMLTNIKGVNGGLVLLGLHWETRPGSTTFDHPIWIRSEITSTDLGGQRGSETMSFSSHHHHDLVTSLSLSCVGRRSPIQVLTRESDRDTSKDGWCARQTCISTRSAQHQ